MADVLRAIGLVPRGGNYETVRRRIDALGIRFSSPASQVRGRPLSTCSDEEIKAAVARSRSIAGAMRELGLRPGGNQARLRERIDRLGIDTRHVVGAGWRIGSTTPPRAAAPLSVLLQRGRPSSSSNLRSRLIAEGLKQRRCEMCRRAVWNGTPIPLELDHVNGRRDDNRLSNLRIPCPNCHAQTETYRGRNIGGAAR